MTILNDSLTEDELNDKLENKLRLKEIEELLSELEYGVAKKGIILNNDQGIYCFKQMIEFLKKEYETRKIKDDKYNSIIEQKSSSFKSFG